MEIKVRDIDPVTIKKIDELAKKSKTSRNTYLKVLLNNFAALNEIKVYQKQYEELMHKVLTVVSKNTDTLEKINSIVGDEIE